MRTPLTTTPAEPKSGQTNSFQADAALISVALIWGINMPVMKIGLDQLDPFVFNAIRLVISSTCLATYAMTERRRGAVPGSEISKWNLLTFAILVSGLYQVLFLLGMARTTVGNTALIMATVPAWTALLARVFISERLTWLSWGGLALALAGTIVVAVQKDDLSSGREYLAGNILILCSALAWAGGTVYSRQLLNFISPVRLSASAAVLALPIHLLLAAGRYQENVAHVQSVNLWLILLYAGVLSSGLALPMWNFGVRHAGAAHAAAVQNLIPLIAIVAAWFSRGEVATLAQIIGGILILTGLMIMRTGRQTASLRADT